jgi:hypothetical protein
VEFVNSFDTPQRLKTILDFLREGYIDELHDGKFEPTRFEFSPYIPQQLKQIAKVKGITEKEDLATCVESLLDVFLQISVLTWSGTPEKR